MSTHEIKIAVGVLVLVGVVIGLFERLYQPNYIVTDNSPDFPGWLGWLGWGVLAVASVVYIGLDVWEWKRARGIERPTAESTTEPPTTQ